ncbi:MAG: hypothetical protein DMG01_14075 [Acidobacteria bacterium]|nr:MAG: hypothetical protein DMG01_14075 [Acidobacteriota bacterium]
MFVGKFRRGSYRDARRSKERRRRLLPEGGEVDRREIHQKIHLKGGIAFESPREIEQRLTRDDDRRVAPVCM